MPRTPLAYDTADFIRKRLIEETEHMDFLRSLEEFHKNRPDFAETLLDFLNFCAVVSPKNGRIRPR